MTRFKGFTLVELMVVVALLAIMAAIAVPNFNSLIKNNRIEAQAEELNALFQYARSEAVIRKTTIQINSDKATGKVEVLQGTTVLRTSNLSNLSDSNPKLEYYPNGTADPANFSAIICDDSSPTSGRLLTVTASGATRLHQRGKQADGTALGSCSV